MKLLTAVLILLATTYTFAYTCEDKSSDCVGLTHLCDDPSLKDVLREQCPKTCGVCYVDGECVDKKSNCEQLKDECNDPDFSDIMSKDCAKTCNQCPSITGCMDRADDCAQAADKCNDTDFRNVMAARCPETCGYCKYYECSDHSTDCAALSGHCNDGADSGFYKYVHENCAKTCRFCFDWVYDYTGYAYKHVMEFSDTFHFMESVCVGFGGHLASIHSFDENYYLIYLNIYRGWSPWIGLHYEDDSLRWTDGTPVDYQYWWNTAERIHCSTMYSYSGSGQWLVTSCSSRTTAVCKKRYHVTDDMTTTW